MRRFPHRLYHLLVLTGLLLAACSGNGTPAGTRPTPTPLPIQPAAAKPVYTVARGDVTAQLQFTARVIPAVQEGLFFRADGRVRKVYVRSGDLVKKGQVLADLVSLDKMETQAKQQALDLRKAQIDYDMAQLQQQLWATQTPDYEPGYEIKRKLQAGQVELAQVALEQAKLQSSDLDTAIADAQITASMDSKVLSIALLEGEDIKAFDPRISVGDDSKLELGATLTAEQMQSLAEKMPATIRVASRPADKLTGSIRSLPYPYGTGNGAGSTPSTSSTGSGPGQDTSARIALDNPSGMAGLRLGDLVEVAVVLKSVSNVLWLPPQAVRSFEGRTFVVIKNPSGLSTRADVKVGIQNEAQIEIKDGLKAGQEVVAP